MNDMNEIVIFNKSDFFDFREWIQLDVDGITWQGRYREDFEYFWALFFVDGYSLTQVIGRFNYARSRVTLGPLIAWFKWLRDKFICYTFVYKGGSIQELSNDAEMSPSKIAQILRDFFIAKFPHLEDSFNRIFSIGNMSSPNLSMTFLDIDKKLNLGSNFIGGYDDEILPSVEVTLYDEWKELISKMEVELYGKGSWVTSFRTWRDITTKFRFLIDLVIVISISVLAIWGIVEGNKYYKQQIKDRISVNDPQFTWLDSSLKFKEQQDNDSQKLEIDSDSLAKMAAAVSEKQKTKIIDESKERYETETEVFIPSVDTLGRDFDMAGLELSEYEEEEKGGYRDTSYGSGKVFRIMMNAVDFKKASEQMKELIGRYKATQVDTVKPGLHVPGGIYYNLYVPVDALDNFFKDVRSIDKTTIYKNSSKTWIPVGKGKVFIWIKSV